MRATRHDLTRSTLALFCIVSLAGLSIWVLRPFLAAALWSATLVVATWPVFLGVQGRLGGRRWLAIGLMLLAMLCFLILPLWLAIDTLLTHGGKLTAAVDQFLATGLPALPAWVLDLPFLGEKLALLWQGIQQDVAAGNLTEGEGVIARMTPYAGDAGTWALAQIGSLGGMLLQFFLVLTIAALMYAGGEAGARFACRFGRRLAGERGENAVILAARATRGVALGVGVTALVQTLLGGLGLGLSGVPLAALLSALMFMLCIAQIGPLPILLPAAGWLLWSGAAGWAIFLAVWSLMVAGLDNFLRPALIRRGADLPLLLIFAGVIGGLLSFGLVGLFVGPVVLAVTWTLLQAWIADALGADEESSENPLSQTRDEAPSSQVSSELAGVTIAETPPADGPPAEVAPQETVSNT